MWRENKSHWNIVRFACKVGGMALCLEIRRGKCPFLPGSVAYVSVWISTDFVLSVRLQIIMLKLDSLVSVPQWHSRLARRTYRQYEKCEGREFDPPLGNCCFCSFFSCWKNSATASILLFQQIKSFDLLWIFFTCAIIDKCHVMSPWPSYPDIRHEARYYACYTMPHY